MFLKNISRGLLIYIVAVLMLAGGLAVTYKVWNNKGPDGRRRFARSYAGQVAIEVPLIGGRIEKGIIEDMRQSLATTAKSTQRWLDQHRPAAVLA